MFINMLMDMSTNMHINTSVRMSVNTTIHISIYISIHMSIHMSIRVSRDTSIRMSIHRYLSAADRIIVMRDGAIIGNGTHDELKGGSVFFHRNMP